MKITESKRSPLLAKGNTVRTIVLTVLGLLTFLPFIFALVISFKDIFQFTHHPFMPTFPLAFENYTIAYRLVIQYIFNSILVSGVSAVFVIAIGLLSGYVFARYDFPFKNQLFFLFLALLMIPTVLSLVTRFTLVMNLGLRDSYWGLILPYVSGGQIVVIFVSRTFFESIPNSLFESAKLEGAGDLTLLYKIAIPLSLAIIWTLVIMNVISTWNNILWPLVIINKVELMPISIGLLNFRGQTQSNTGAMMAGYLIASLPLLLVFSIASKQFVRGLTSGAIKM
jgi:multiple sugar transport system permease protein/raffinose/stachyose/melibiose transport system permease protein